MNYEFKMGYISYGSYQNHLLCERWRQSWSQYSNQMIQEILLRFQEPHQSKSGKLKTVDYKAQLQATEAKSSE